MWSSELFEVEIRLIDNNPSAVYVPDGSCNYWEQKCRQYRRVGKAAWEPHGQRASVRSTQVGAAALPGAARVDIADKVQGAVRERKATTETKEEQVMEKCVNVSKCLIPR